ncbi:hypothetical protein [Polaribacter glomeratus]|uniref:Uncharacterized protein n=1 Tax=Polaribacter glomeratus TaxID=102 RepID=A0A2S7WUI9_9FLAO|nr:hypothetical protein [Polaribacter glomeratus]PQJ81264.1 hypothetical protein BTO16_01100 [Polaribacter glomeratus]TXD65819.1 hypothetical protein ESX12_09365 [Polaribacter glomeratus]
MKTLKIVLLFVAIFVMNSTNTYSQIQLKVNIAEQPLWGPVSYNHVEYYYLPEYDIYYNAPKAQFIHRKGNKWINANSLPYEYRNVNLYSTYKVVINDSKPYLKHNYYSKEYKGYKNYRSKQGSIRDSKDSKYMVIINHPNNKKYKKQSNHKSDKKDSHKKDKH